MQVSPQKSVTKSPPLVHLPTMSSIQNTLSRSELHVIELSRLPTSSFRYRVSSRGTHGKLITTTVYPGRRQAVSQLCCNRPSEASCPTSLLFSRNELLSPGPTHGEEPFDGCHDERSQTLSCTEAFCLSLHVPSTPPLPFPQNFCLHLLGFPFPDDGSHSIDSTLIPSRMYA